MAVEIEPRYPPKSEMHPHDRGEKAYNLKQRIQNRLLDDPQVAIILAKLAFEPRGVLSSVSPHDSLWVSFELSGTPYRLTLNGFRNEEHTNECMLLLRSGENYAEYLKLETEYAEIGDIKYFQDGAISSSSGLSEEEVLQDVEIRFPELFPPQE